MPPEPQIRAVLDANVLFPIRLCDTLLRAAEVGLYQPLWTAQILTEVERNLVAQRRSSVEEARRRCAAMHAKFPIAMVTGYEGRIAAMPNHPNDRHILAAAIDADADVIVTQNLRHLPTAAIAPYSVGVAIGGCLPADAFRVRTRGRSTHHPRASGGLRTPATIHCAITRTARPRYAGIRRGRGGTHTHRGAT